MNYTEKYHLPQWEEQDRVMRTDFNQMCLAIDTGMAAAQEKADEKGFVTGVYSGTAKEFKVTLGFRPAVLIISTLYNAITPENAAGTCSMFFSDLSYGAVKIEDDGFSLRAKEATNTYPNLNWNGYKYLYMAFQ